jgi:hypothetical protein
MTGYNGGLGVAFSGAASNFAAGFPLAVEFSIRHTRLEPGSPERARRIFINDAENGTPQKSGWMWDMQLDFLHRASLLRIKDAYLFAGIRRSLFTANFRFVGGNEDFDVTTNQWGIGGGVKAAFPMGGNVSFVVKTGLDYYFSSTLYAHDTSYDPAGTSVNGKHDYTYSDADAVVNQPKFEFSGMFGISYGF